MNFDELNALVPYAKGGKQKVLSMRPYDNIVLLMPGRHADDSKGGDFCVCVTDSVFPVAEHQFTHTDIFKDVELKITKQQNPTIALMKDYLKVIQGADAKVGDWSILMTRLDAFNNGIADQTFLHAVQCLAVAEHRRYERYESKFGGRYLPFRFAAGIAQGLWTADDAIGVQRMGRPGVEMLEKQNGVPKLTQELMK